MSVKGRIVRMFSGVALTRAAVGAVQEIGGFQRLLVQCEVQKFSAGAKVQLLLPSDDVRTYTPIPSPDGMILLGWRHAGGPGAHWMSNVNAGDELLFVGPRRSLELNAGPVVLIGDETSVAVAAAFAAERPGQIHAVFQADTASDIRAAGASVGLHQVDILKRGDIASIVDAVAAKLSIFPDAAIALTGGSELVIAVRLALRQAGMRNIKTKAYWIPGRTGLD